MKKKYHAWFICDDSLLLAANPSGDQRLATRPKRGIPSGAITFGSEEEAKRELQWMIDRGAWPLFTPTARIERISWT